MESAPGFGGGNTAKFAKRPLEPRIDAAKLYLLVRGHATNSRAVAEWRSSLLLRHPLLPSTPGVSGSSV